MMRPFAAQTPLEGAQMRPQQPSLVNGMAFLYLHEMRAYRDGYSDDTLLDILRGCRKYNVTKLVIETNFGDGIVSELFKKHIQQTQQYIDIEEIRAKRQERGQNY